MEFKPHCYQLHYETSLCKPSLIFSEVEKIGTLIWDNGKFFVFLRYNKSKSDLLKILKKVGISEVFCEEIFAENQTKQNTFFEVWYKNVYESEFVDFINNEMTEKLNKISKNVKKANDLIDERLKEHRNSTQNQEKYFSEE